VLGDYFSVMEIDVLAGRTFRPSDDASSENVVVVSEDFVRAYFPGTPIAQVPGRTVGTIMLMDGPSIVAGVVRSTRHRGPDTPSTPDVYIPFAQQGTLAMAELLVAGDPDRTAAVVPAVLAEVTPDVRWSPLVSYTSYLSEWYAPFRFQVIIIGVLAGLGLLLASLGLYALMAYQVAVRRHEIGIRKALGASDERLMRGVIAPGIAMSAAGAALGLLAWYQLLPWTSGLLDGVDDAGAAVPLSVVLVVGLSCLAATFVPAFRATRMDPVATLKAE
ncbi:MAG TPA: FtsX-like permease family protein, partial [Longimicrobiales bacterium]|nr:FtsX-like permease family protein [Longimicrobiales bacterium]